MKKLALVAAGLAVAAATLTGCTPPPTAAAVVEGTEIPVSIALGSVPTIVAVLGAPQAAAQQTAVLVFTQAEVSNVLAARHNLNVSDADIAALIAGDANWSAIADMDGGAALVEAAARTGLVVNRLGEETYLKELPSVHVETNPRFGTWNPTTGRLADPALSAIAPKA